MDRVFAALVFAPTVLLGVYVFSWGFSVLAR